MNALALRRARSEVIPQIPTLATKLAEDGQVIHRAIVNSLVDSGATTSTLQEADINKVERHAIAGFLIGQQRRLLIDGAGSAAHFRGLHRQLLTRVIGPQPYLFRSDLNRTMAHGAAKIEDMFTNGQEPEYRWLPDAKAHYNRLGARAMQLSRESGIEEGIPNEGVVLDNALRTEALGSAIIHHAAFLRRRVISHRRLDAAHDLSYLPAAYASSHVLEIIDAQPLDSLDSEVVQDVSTGRYELLNRHPRNSDVVYPHIDEAELPNTTIQCAARAMRDGVTGHTDLNYFVHAAINAAWQYKLL